MYTYYQNTHTVVKTPTQLSKHPHSCQNTRILQNPYTQTPRHYKTHIFTHPYITIATHTHPHITKQVKTTTVQDIHQIKYSQYD